MIKFFIQRPIFATVIAIIMTLVGIIALFRLPVEQMPDIAPPQVSVASIYQGASAEIMANVVTTPIEEQINGVDGMLYMSSVSTNNGESTITVTFDIGYDLDMASVQVQNRVENAKPQLPDVVQRNAVVVDKVSNNITLALHLLSPNGTYDNVYLGNYADIHITDPLLRIPGISQVTNFGLRQYSIRIWLDPNKLASLGLAANDITEAVQAQNNQVTAGRIGEPPIPAGQAFEYQLNALGRLDQVEQFEDIIVRTEANGAVVRVKDVARVELGAEDYSNSSTFNGQPTATLVLYQWAGANTLKISNEVKALMENLSKNFPDDLTYDIAYDTSMFVRESIREVIITLFQAIGLVVFVVLLFLQTWRATLIPLIAIPVSLIGTFAIMQLFGFSINTLSLLGLVLAVGLVVDDAIVVVENVQRRLQAGAKNLKEATLAAMEEVKGPIIATTLVLMAVFIPVAFIPGISGQLYKQFALTVAFAVALSGINSLTLSPALCATFLRRDSGYRFAAFKWFNQAFEASRTHYQGLLQKLLKHRYLVVIGFIILGLITFFIYRSVPTGFIPEEDQGYFITSIQGPDASTLERTEVAADQAQQMIQAIPGVADIISIRGFNFLTFVNEPNSALLFVVLDPWSERKQRDLHVDAIMVKAQQEVNRIEQASIFVFNAPPIRGLSATGGFEFELQDTESLGLESLAETVRQFMVVGNQQPELQGIISTFSTNVPQYYLDIDRTKATNLNLNLGDVFNTLQIYLGSLYVNDFNKYGRTYKVMLQADGDYRSDKEDILNLYARNQDGNMVPLSTIVTIEPTDGPYAVERYNLYTSAKIQGGPAPGYSAGQAVAAMERVAGEVMPEGISYEWTGTVYQQLKAGNLAPIIFILSLVFVFLFLAAQYESWVMPFMILLAVPLALLGAGGALLVRHLALDIYGQIGLVMLIGLSAKNAILIVEFARRQREQGAEIVQAAIQAARIRLRPILMTAFAFILGVIPLVLASGAGAASRNSLGTVILGGMLVSTILSLLVVPVLYVLLEFAREKFLNRPKQAN